jgi:hypothetical protein
VVSEATKTSGWMASSFWQPHGNQRISNTNCSYKVHNFRSLDLENFIFISVRCHSKAG